MKRPKKKVATRAEKKLPARRSRRRAPADVTPAASPPPAPARIDEGIDRSRRARATQELTWADFDTQVQRMAMASRRFRPHVVVGLTHGGVFVGGALASALKADFFPVRIARRARDVTRRLPTRMPAEMALVVKGKRVLVVDDVAGSGEGLELAMQLAKLAGAAKVTSASLVARPGGFEPDVAAYTSDVFFVFPWDYQAVVEDARFDPDAAGA